MERPNRGVSWEGKKRRSFRRWMCMATMVAAMFCTFGLLYSPAAHSREHDLSKLTDSELDQWGNFLMKKLVKELDRIRNYLSWYDQLLRMNIVQGIQSVKEADTLLSAKGKKLYQRSFQAAELEKLLGKHRTSFERFLRYTRKEVEAVSTGSGEAWAGAAFERLKELHRQYDRQMTQRLDTVDILREMNGFLARVKGYERLPVKLDYFAGHEKRIMSAIPSRFLHTTIASSSISPPPQSPWATPQEHPAQSKPTEGGMPKKSEKAKPTLDQDAARHFQLGLVFYKKKQFLKAEAKFREAVHLDPENTRYVFNLGNALYRQGKWSEAETAYRKAIKVNPKQALYHDRLGIVLYKMRKLAEAEEAYRKAVELDPENPDIHNRLGVALAGQKKFKASEDQYRLAVGLEPGNARFHTNLGVSCRRQNKLADAEAALRKATHLKPNLAQAWFELGEVNMHKKNYTRAESSIGEAVRLDPENASYRNCHGNALYKLKKWSDAEAEYRKAVSMDPKKGVYRANLAGSIFKQGRSEEAVKTAKEAIRRGYRKHWVYKALELTTE